MACKGCQRRKAAIQRTVRRVKARTAKRPARPRRSR